MHVKLEKDHFTGSRTHRKGDVIEMPDERAAELVRARLAVPHVMTDAPPETADAPGPDETPSAPPAPETADAAPPAETRRKTKPKR